MSKTIISKRCCHCKQSKPLNEFYRNKSSDDGHHYECKVCKNERDRVYRRSAKGKAVNRRYQQSEKGKAAYKRYNQTEKGKARQKRYPNQIKATRAVNHAIRAGKLPRPDTFSCHYCPKPAQQYHHWHGYEKEHWLDVVPVCIDCHNNLP